MGNRRYFRCTTALAMVCCAAPGWAQAPAAAAASSPGLEEIMVTARRRSERIEKVPVSITLFGKTALAARQIRTEADLQASVPGLTIRQTVSQNQLNYSIRGQSVDAFSGSAPGVLPYIDDIQLATNSATSFYDLQNIQVLKGPQGTLFGRNATGGAVLYETTRPSEGYHGYIQGNIGNYDTHGIQGAVDLPLVPGKVLLRLAGNLQLSNGYVHNLYSDTWLGGQDEQSGRATLVIKPTEGLTNTTTFQFNYDGGTNAPTQLYSANACGSSNNGIPLLSTTACLYDPADPYFLDFLATHPRAYPGGIAAFVAYQKSLGPWKADVDFPAAHVARGGFVANTTTYDINANLTLKNVFGFSSSRSNEQNDFDGTPYPIFAAGSDASPRSEIFTVSQSSEELQLQGNALNHRVTYILGGYYESQTNQFDYPLLAFDLSPDIPGTPVHYHWETYDKTEAMFGQASFRITPRLSFTAGGRYTWEQTSLHQLEESLFLGAPSESTTTSKPSWTFSLDYQLLPSLLVYATTRGSWRTGGFNGTSLPVNAYASAGGNLFKPETTTDYEFGAKFSGQVYDRPVRLNVSYYNQVVDDIQRTAYLLEPTGPLAITVNVPQATITGVEADGVVQVAPWLQIGGSVSYADARFNKPDTSFLGTTVSFGPFGDTPLWSGTVFGQVTQALPGSLGTLSLRGDLYAQTKQFFSNLNETINPQTDLPGYSLINMRLEWSQIGGRNINAALYVRNLTNRAYYVGGIPQGADLGLNQASPGRPQMYGLDVRYGF